MNDPNLGTDCVENRATGCGLVERADDAAIERVMNHQPDAPERWNSLLAPYKQSSMFRSLLQLIPTAALFVGAWWTARLALDVSYWLTLLVSIVGGALMVRLFMFFHDCVHGSFFKWPFANRWIGRLLGVLTLTPYRFWRRNHVLHHATSGNLDRRGFGDVDTLTVHEYLAKSAFGRLVYRFSRNPLVLIVLGPPYLFLLKHRLPLGMPLSWKKEWASIVWNNLALAAVIVTMSFVVGLGTFLKIQTPMFCVSTMTGIWLFYVQHQFGNTYWRRNDRWEFGAACLSGSSYLDLPRPLRWVTANIGVHHIHHLCSAIPNYRLWNCMNELKDLPQPRRITLWQSLRCFRLSLWDEREQRLVGYAHVREQARS
jgi:acyl-lipid omega-6 desaturase (Delta-12 desaturase)